MKQGWEIKKLGEIADVEYGFTGKAEEEGDYRYIRITDIDSNGQLITIEKKYLKHSNEAKGFLIQNNDLLMARTGATFAKVLLYEDIEPSVFASYLIRIKFKQKFENKLYWYFTKTKSYWDQANSLASGSAQPHFNGSAVKEVFFPYPKSLPEQKRIVAILDEAFAAIAKAKENAERNLKNAKELFESYLQGVFENKGEDWREKTLGEVASFSQGIQVGLEKHLSEPKSGYVRFIRIVDYTQNTDDIRFVPDPGEKYFVKEDDIVMIRYGTPGLIGRGKSGVIANNLFKITIEIEELSKDFFCLYLSQKHIQTYLRTQGSATMPALNFGHLRSVVIDYPSLEEQQSIVLKLDALSAETKKLEAIYQKKISDLEELKKSILQKAFIGELTEGVAV